MTGTTQSPPRSPKKAPAELESKVEPESTESTHTLDQTPDLFELVEKVENEIVQTAANSDTPADDYQIYLNIIEKVERQQEAYAQGLSRMTRETFDKLSTSDKKHFATFVANTNEACNMICDVDHAQYTDKAFKASMSTAFHAMNRLNSRPWISACFGVLAGIAAVAAALFQWPLVAGAAAGAAIAHLLAGGGLVAVAAAASTAVASTALVFANESGLFRKPKFAALKELTGELEVQHSANMKAAPATVGA